MQTQTKSIVNIRCNEKDHIHATYNQPVGPIIYHEHINNYQPVIDIESIRFGQLYKNRLCQFSY